MIPSSTILVLCSVLLLKAAVGAAIDARVFPGCVVLGTNLYCYGGFLGAQGGQFIKATSDHFTVDLSTANLNVLKPTLNWTTIAPPAANQGPALEPRGNFPIAAIDQSRYVILGGAPINTTLNTPAILYDSSKNAWQALADPPFYMSNGAMVASSNGNTAWAYGGTLNSSAGITPPNILNLDLTGPAGAGSLGVWTTRANSVASPLTTRHGHAAIIRNNQIYYFGGFFATSATQSTAVPMNRVHFYNTVSDQWGIIICGGDNPSNRTYHTATLISNSSTVLIYGGTGRDYPQAIPYRPYAYLWDVNSHQYKELPQAPGDPGPRIGHSAVQYKNTILISFGYDGSGNIRSDTTVLDVSSPASPSWVASQSSVTSDPNDDGGQTNTGAIAGGVVGGVAGIAIIAGIFFYFHRRKKNQLVRNDFDLYQPPEGFNANDSPTLFPSSDGNRYSDAGNNKAAAADAAVAPGSVKNNNENSRSPPLEMYSTDPTPNYHQIKPDENCHRTSSDAEPLSRVKPSGND